MKSRNQPTETMLALTAACVAGYMLFHAKALLWAGLFLALTGILSADLSRQIDRGWRGLAMVLGRVSNAVLLSVVYLVILLPVAVYRRLRKKERLTRFDKNAVSNFVGRERVVSREDFERVW